LPHLSFIEEFYAGDSNQTVTTEIVKENKGNARFSRYNSVTENNLLHQFTPLHVSVLQKSSSGKKRKEGNVAAFRKMSYRKSDCT
jgi:hypothetical protein